MRLGQLARQLDIKPEKIVSYLEKEKAITITKHPNSKVDDDLVDAITAHFKPVIEEVETAEEIEAVVEVKPAEEDAAAEQAVEEVLEVQKEPEHIETAKPEATPELKIIGKIDLPDKSQINVEVDGVVYDQETLDNKKKEELAADRERKAIEKEEKRKEEEEKREKAREQRKIEQERKAMLETEKHNILTKEEERKKEIIIKAQQEREQKLEENRKQKQKEYYAQQVSAKSPAKKQKKNTTTKTTEEVVTGTTEEATAVEAPVEEVKEKSAFKRFIKWLNT